VITVVGAVFLNILRSSSDTLHSLKLNQEMRAVMALMVSDIRRAGYWGEAADATGSAAYDNPFTTRTGVAHDIHVHDNGACVMYSYDLDYTGAPGPLMGFWLSDGRVMGIKSGVAASGVGTASCGGNAGEFESFTDESVVTITALQFSTAESICRNLDTGGTWNASNGTLPACDNSQTGYTATTGDRLVETRRLEVRLVGEHAEDSEFTMELESDVLVRNNRLLLAI